MKIKVIRTTLKLLEELSRINNRYYFLIFYKKTSLIGNIKTLKGLELYDDIIKNNILIQIKIITHIEKGFAFEHYIEILSGENCNLISYK